MLETNIKTPEWLLQMENILETLNEGVAIVDDGLRVVFANEALLRLFGYDRGDMYGRTPDTVFPPDRSPIVPLENHDLRETMGFILIS